MLVAGKLTIWRAGDERRAELGTKGRKNHIQPISQACQKPRVRNKNRG
jgi:hypothetical protein